MLPQVQPLRNVDPDYTIYDLAIEIPKGELVAESLQMLNDRINGSEEVKKTRAQPEPREQLPFNTVAIHVPSTSGTTVWHPNLGALY